MPILIVAPASQAHFSVNLHIHKANIPPFDDTDAINEFDIVADTLDPDDGASDNEGRTWSEHTRRAHAQSRVSDIHAIGKARRVLIWIGLGLAILAGVTAAVLMSVWALHVVLSPSLRWLSAGEIAQIQTILFSGAFSAVATLLGRTVLGARDDA